MKSLNVLGLTVFFAGIFSLVGFGVYKFFEDSTVSLIVKLGIVGIILGIIILLVSLIKERIKEKEDDISNNK